MDSQGRLQLWVHFWLQGLLVVTEGGQALVEGACSLAEEVEVVLEHLFEEELVCEELIKV